MQITSDMLTTMNDAYRANPVMKAAALAMGHQPLNEVVFNCENAAKGRFLFNHEVETMKVTNQKSSGRCWLFAALNLFREIAAKKMNVEFFELSQNFIAYYDKLEKANYFLDSIMQTLDLPKDDRMVTYIVSTGIQDGGQWDMMANLVKKYGLVPKAAMPETFQSENTRSLNAAINIKLRRAAAILRREYRGGASTEALNSICRETLADVHDMLTAGYGCRRSRSIWNTRTRTTTSCAWPGSRRRRSSTSISPSRLTSTPPSFIPRPTTSPSAAATPCASWATSWAATRFPT